MTGQPGCIAPLSGLNASSCWDNPAALVTGSSVSGLATVETTLLPNKKVSEGWATGKPARGCIVVAAKLDTWPPKAGVPLPRKVEVKSTLPAPSSAMSQTLALVGAGPVGRENGVVVRAKLPSAPRITE